MKLMARFSFISACQDLTQLTEKCTSFGTPSVPFTLCILGPDPLINHIPPTFKQNYRPRSEIYAINPSHSGILLYILIT